MPTFHYRALGANGQIAEGQIEAGGRAEAFRQIESQSLRPISLKEGVNGKARASTPKPAPVAPTGNTQTSNADAPSETPTKFSFASGKISARILENFTRLLSSLLAAGVPLSRALVILQKEAANPTAKAKWKEVHDLVVDGMTLADAMSKSPETFPKVYVAMVEAGETGGFLDVVLGQIADFQAREKEMRGKVIAAMIYPAILMVLALCVLTVMLTFFVPKFQAMFASFGGQLPLLTQIIVGVSQVVRSYGLLVAVVIGVSIFLGRAWIVSPVGRRAWEGLLLRTPVIGNLIGQFAMSRFCRMLGTLLGAGVPLINSLNVARRAIGNQILSDAVSNSTNLVKEGKALGVGLAECRTLFPGSVLEMISVAEESGKLDQELVRIANVTEGDLDRHLKIAVAMIEPVMLFLIAAFIGTIFIGMVLPIFTLADYVK
ncbi:MAG: type II secretion system F family protein [Verrucomicrobia bacterium]|nr:MAG: type II secretion system F family protein [Verrucomicrobiota bacterium]